MYCTMAIALITNFVLIEISDKLAPYGLIPFAAVVVSTAYLMFGIRCPRCRDRITPVVVHGTNPFRVSPRLRFCPFCGVNLDAESEADSAASSSTDPLGMPSK